MSGKGDFKIGDKTEIGMGSDEVRTLPADSGLGFWASQEGNMGGARAHNHGGQQQQQAQIPQDATVTVVTVKPVVKQADGGLPKDRHGGEFNFDSYEPIGSVGGRLDLDM